MAKNPRTLDDVIKGLPLDQQQEVATQAAWLIEEEMTLPDPREAQELKRCRMQEKVERS